jgi:hypothetical protein
MLYKPLLTKISTPQCIKTIANFEWNHTKCEMNKTELVYPKNNHNQNENFLYYNTQDTGNST